MYPRFALVQLGSMWGRGWQRLVKQVVGLPTVDPASMAFTLLMRRLRIVLGSQSQCSATCVDPACALCAVELLAHYDGSERDLLKEYKVTLQEVQSFIKRQRQLVSTAA